MQHRSRRVWLGIAAVSAAMFTSMAGGDFLLIEDFDDLLLAPIDEQGGWQAQHDTSVVVVDPDQPTNQVLAVTTDSACLFREVLLLNGTTRMMFLRFRIAEQQNFSLGMSDSTFPTQFDDFEVELGTSNSTDELRINDDGRYEVLTVLEQDTWYNCWLLINNENETTDVFLHSRPGDSALMSDRLDAGGQTSFIFRRGSALDLRTFFIKTGGGSGPAGPLYIDDMYLENTDALNLGNPLDAACPGDLDGDGDTDQSDLGILLASYGVDGGGDLDGDGDTDQSDLGILLADYGCTP